MARNLDRKRRTAETRTRLDYNSLEPKNLLAANSLFDSLSPAANMSYERWETSAQDYPQTAAYAVQSRANLESAYSQWLSAGSYPPSDTWQELGQGVSARYVTDAAEHVFDFTSQFNDYFTQSIVDLATVAKPAVKQAAKDAMVDTAAYHNCVAASPKLLARECLGDAFDMSANFLSFPTNVVSHAYGNSVDDLLSDGAITQDVADRLAKVGDYAELAFNIRAAAKSVRHLFSSSSIQSNYLSFLNDSITIGDFANDSIAFDAEQLKNDSGTGVTFFKSVDEIRQDQQVHTGLAISSLDSHQQSPLSEADLEALRTLRLNDPEMLNQLYLTASQKQDLINLLGPTTTVSVGFDAYTGILEIRGTEYNDTIDVGRKPDDHSILQVNTGNELLEFNRNDVHRVIIFGEAGNDELVVRDDVETVMFGGPGQDRLVDGWGRGVLHGNDGNDELLGRGGDDHLDGGNGTDQLWGGPGSNIYFDDGLDSIFQRDLRPVLDTITTGGTGSQSEHPALGSLSARVLGDGFGNDFLSLNATDVDGNGGHVRRVEFFHDTNGDGMGQIDEFLHADYSPKYGWIASLDTEILSDGVNEFLARAVGANLLESAWAGDSVDYTPPGSEMPDLIGLDLQIDPDDSVYALGKILDLSFRVKNAGQAYAHGPFMVSAYWSGDNQLDPSEDKYLGGISIANLAAGTNTGVAMGVSLPDELAAGILNNQTSHILLSIDSNNDVEESDESNNHGQELNEDYREIVVSQEYDDEGSPVIGHFEFLPDSTLYRGAEVTAISTNVVDDVLVNELVYFYDSDNSGTLNAGDQYVDHASKSQTTFTARFDTSGYDLGDNLFFARAKDNVGNYSIVKSAILTLEGVGDAAPDRFENNNTPETANDFGSGGTFVESNLSITSGDVDWYMVRKAAGKADISARIDFFQEPTGNGNLVAELYRMDSDGSLSNFGFSNSSGPGDTFEMVSKSNIANGTWLVRVSGAGMAESDNYQLTLELKDRPGHPSPSELSASATRLKRTELLDLWFDTTGLADSDVGSVQFFNDFDRSGTISASESIGVDWGPNPSGENGHFGITADTSNWLEGKNDIYAYVNSSGNLQSATRYISIEVFTNQAPVLHNLTYDSQVEVGSLLEVTAEGVHDPDGLVAAVRLHHDVNANQQLDAGDVLLGTFSASGDDYQLSLDTGLGIATHDFIVSMTDNDGLATHSVFQSEFVAPPNEGPEIGAVESDLEIDQGQSLSLSVLDVVDPHNVSDVQAFLDSNSSGSIDAEDILLGSATQTGNDWVLDQIATDLWASGELNLLINTTDEHPTDPKSTVASHAITVHEKPELVLFSGEIRFREDSGVAAGELTVLRTGDTTLGATVLLTSSDETEIALPESVSFLPGESVVTVPFDVVDDDHLDGIQTIDVSATLDGYRTGTISMEVSSTELLISSSTINENQAAGTHLGALSVHDVDFGQVDRFELVSGAGDEHNDEFTVSGFDLVVAGELDYETTPVKSVRVRAIDTNGLTLDQVFTINLNNLVEVESFTWGDGTQQRSRIDQMVVLFDELVDVGSNGFLLQSRGENGSVVSTSHTIEDIGGKTQVVLTFNDHTRANGALVDDNYQVTIDQVTRRGTNVELDGEKNGVEGSDFVLGNKESHGVFAYYGDTDGDRDVDGLDFGRFVMAFFKNLGDDGYNRNLDYDDDGDIDGIDFGQFKKRFFESLDFE